MDEKTLFYKILGLHPPWLIKQVVINEPDQQVDIYIDHDSGIRVRCQECDNYYGFYDHASEMVYRHLNTCQMATYIHVRPPRVKCPNHGVSQMDVW